MDYVPGNFVQIQLDIVNRTVSQQNAVFIVQTHFRRAESRRIFDNNALSYDSFVVRARVCDILFPATL